MNREQFLKKIKETQFETDFEQVIQINNSESSKGMWNLILSIRDCGLYAKGIKPHRFWKITDVKRYFGISGDASKCKVQLEEYLTFIKSIS